MKRLKTEMEVKIKNLNIASMQVTENGIELSIYDKGTHLGDLVLTDSQLIWCKGKTTPPNGKAVSWESFIERMEGNSSKK